MNELTASIVRIQQGETAAYARVIEQFQDMAVGYAYAALGDLAAAEDVAQEAFIAAYYTIAALREPAAFPGWFRRIVQTQINRVKRRRVSGFLSDRVLANEPTLIGNPVGRSIDSKPSAKCSDPVLRNL